MTFGVRTDERASPERWARGPRFYGRGPGTLYRKLKSIQFLMTRDRNAVARFLLARYPIPLSLSERIDLLRAFTRTTNSIRGYHTLAEILAVSDAIFRRAGRRELVVVEAGAGSGSSTAKLSLVVSRAGGRLFVFDTFQGIPENEEKHQMLDGQTLEFRRGAFRGRLSAVKRRVETFGAIDVCEFHKGLVEDTMRN